jgi:leader peptidase (prepilin peptidase) / N-methyltransferase
VPASAPRSGVPDVRPNSEINCKQTASATRVSPRPRLVLRFLCCAVAVTPLLRWAILTHSVSGGRAWRRTCPRCAVRLGPVGDLLSLSPLGRCGTCGQRLGPRWAVEVAFAASLALLLTAGLRNLPLVAFAWWAAISVVLAFVDATVHRLPSRLCYLAAGGSAVLLLGQAAVSHAWGPWVRLAVGALVAATAVAACAVLTPAMVRWGDVRFALVIGGTTAWFGWFALYATALLATLAAAAVGLGLVAKRRASLKTHLPQGPFWFAAALFVIAVAGVGPHNS